MAGLGSVVGVVLLLGFVLVSTETVDDVDFLNGKGDVQLFSELELDENLTTELAEHTVTDCDCGSYTGDELVEESGNRGAIYKQVRIKAEDMAGDVNDESLTLPSTLCAFKRMQTAALAAGVSLKIESAHHSLDRQLAQFECFLRRVKQQDHGRFCKYKGSVLQYCKTLESYLDRCDRCKGKTCGKGCRGMDLSGPICNDGVQVAFPGTSAHGDGHALDLAFTSENSGEFKWLAKNAHAFGFVRTLSSEPFHWELRHELKCNAKVAYACVNADTSCKAQGGVCVQGACGGRRLIGTVCNQGQCCPANTQCCVHCGVQAVAPSEETETVSVADIFEGDLSDLELDPEVDDAKQQADSSVREIVRRTARALVGAGAHGKKQISDLANLCKMKIEQAHGDDAAVANIVQHCEAQILATGEASKPNPAIIERGEKTIQEAEANGEEGIKVAEESAVVRHRDTAFRERLADNRVERELDEQRADKKAEALLKWAHKDAAKMAHEQRLLDRLTPPGTEVTQAPKDVGDTRTLSKKQRMIDRENRLAAAKAKGEAAKFLSQAHHQGVRTRQLGEGEALKERDAAYHAAQRTIEVSRHGSALAEKATRASAGKALDEQHSLGDRGEHVIRSVAAAEGTKTQQEARRQRKLLRREERRNAAMAKENSRAHRREIAKLQQDLAQQENLGDREFTKKKLRDLSSRDEKEVASFEAEVQRHIEREGLRKVRREEREGSRKNVALLKETEQHKELEKKMAALGRLNEREFEKVEKEEELDKDEAAMRRAANLQARAAHEAAGVRKDIRKKEDQKADRALLERIQARLDEQTAHNNHVAEGEAKLKASLRKEAKDARHGNSRTAKKLVAKLEREEARAASQRNEDTIKSSLRHFAGDKTQDELRESVQDEASKNFAVLRAAERKEEAALTDAQQKAAQQAAVSDLGRRNQKAFVRAARLSQQATGKAAEEMFQAQQHDIVESKAKAGVRTVVSEVARSNKQQRQRDRKLAKSMRESAERFSTLEHHHDAETRQEERRLAQQAQDAAFRTEETVEKGALNGGRILEAGKATLEAARELQKQKFAEEAAKDEERYAAEEAKMESERLGRVDARQQEQADEMRASSGARLDRISGRQDLVLSGNSVKPQ